MLPTTLGIKDNRFIEIIKSKEPNLQKLILSGQKEATQIQIFEACRQFIDLNSPAENNKELAIQFAEDILETRPDWKMEDIKYLFKFIRQRQDIPELKLFGNKITGIRLMEMVVTYENYKSEGREKVVAETKINDNFVNEKTENKELQNYLDKLKTTVEKVTERPPANTGVKYNAFDPIKNIEHFEQFKQLITDSTPEEKEKWRKSIVVFESIDEIEMQRKTKLLELLNK